MGDHYDCRACGACCAVWDVEVVPADNVPEDLVKADRMGLNQMRQRGPDKRCVALRGVIGTCAACAIYTSRPAVCVEFEPGSVDCIVARERFGVEPPVAPPARLVEDVLAQAPWATTDGVVTAVQARAWFDALPKLDKAMAALGVTDTRDLRWQITVRHFRAARLISHVHVGKVRVPVRVDPARVRW